MWKLACKWARLTYPNMPGGWVVTSYFGVFNWPGRTTDIRQRSDRLLPPQGAPGPDRPAPHGRRAGAPGDPLTGYRDQRLVPALPGYCSCTPATSARPRRSDGSGTATRDPQPCDHRRYGPRPAGRTRRASHIRAAAVVSAEVPARHFCPAPELSGRALPPRHEQRYGGMERLGRQRDVNGALGRVKCPPVGVTTD